METPYSETVEGLKQELALVRVLAEDQKQELLTLLREAVEDIEGWSDYANEYFKWKHKLTETLERYRSKIKEFE